MAVKVKSNSSKSNSSNIGKEILDKVIDEWYNEISELDKTINSYDLSYHCKNVNTADKRSDNSNDYFNFLKRMQNDSISLEK